MVPDLDMRRFTDFKDNLRLKWGYGRVFFLSGSFAIFQVRQL